MRLLDRYIVREYLRALFAVTFILTVLMLISIVLQHVDDVFERQISLSLSLKWFVLLLPYQIVQAVPIIVLLAVLFSMGNLSRHNEIIAMVSTGVSRGRIFLPVLAVTAALTLFTLWFNEFLVPRASEAARYIDRVRVQGKPPPSEARETFVEGADNTYYWMEAYLDYPNRQRMIHPVVIHLSPDRERVLERIDARWATHVKPNRPGAQPHWEFHSGTKWIFNEDGTLRDVQSFRSRPIELEDDLTEFLSKRKKPEEMNYLELRRYINIMSHRGGVDLDRYLTELNLKISFPLALIIVAMLAYPLALKTRPGALFMGFSLAIVWIIGFYGFVAILRSLGHEGHLWPWFAAWAPNAVFAVAALYFMGLGRT
jgi:lipopolysaccharide export system permease protein